MIWGGGECVPIPAEMGRQARKDGLHDLCLFNQRFIQRFFGPCGQSAKEEKGTERVSEEKVTDYLPLYYLPDIGPPRSDTGLDNNPVA